MADEGTEAPRPSSSPKESNNMLVSVGIAVGACGVGVMSTAVQLKTSEFYNFAGYALVILKQTQFVNYVAHGTLAIGFLGVLVGFFLGVAGFLVARHPRCSTVAMVLMFIHGIVSLAIGGVIMGGISQLDSAIYSQSTKPPVFGSFTSDAIHFQLAMFNGCCVQKDRSWSKEEFFPTGSQSPDALDDNGYVKYCLDLHELNQLLIQSEGTRSCYRSQETYRVMNASVNGINLPRICSALSQASVNVVGKTVPGKPSLLVTTLTFGQPTVAIVGTPSAPTYGCGIGYAKAFQAAMLIWVANMLQPLANALLITGVLDLFFLLLAWTTNFSIAATNKRVETKEEAYARYMKEIEAEQMQKPNGVQVVAANPIDDKI